jgi:hypothetical protein
MIRPILEYGCVIFFEEGSELANQLENIPYQAGLQLTGALGNTSHDKILKELGWQPLADRVKLLRATLSYKVIYGKTNQYFSTYVHQRLHRNEVDYNLRRRPALIAPPHRSRRYNRSRLVSIFGTPSPLIYSQPVLLMLSRFIIRNHTFQV